MNNMELSIEEFTHIKFGTMRTTFDKNEIWFSLADACRILNLSNPSKVASRLDDDEKMIVDFIHGHSGIRGGAQKMTFINEPALYRIIIKSNKPEAKPFQKWLFSEVLPKLRKDQALRDEFGYDNFFAKEFDKFHQQFIETEQKGELLPVPVSQVALEFNLTENDILLLAEYIGYDKLIITKNGIKCFRIKRFADYMREELVRNNIHGDPNLYSPVFVINKY